MDVRNFEAAIEGRDVIANDNNEYCTFITLNKPVYDAGGSKLVRYESISDDCNQYYQNNNLSTTIPAKVTDLAKALETVKMRLSCIIRTVETMPIRTLCS